MVGEFFGFCLSDRNGGVLFFSSLYNLITYIILKVSFEEDFRFYLDEVLRLYRWSREGDREIFIEFLFFRVCCVFDILLSV